VFTKPLQTVIPVIGRRVTVPWRLGEWRLPANSSVLVSILLVHHHPYVRSAAAARRD
jgi:cytochrome P450